MIYKIDDLFLVFFNYKFFCIFEKNITIPRLKVQVKSLKNIELKE